MNNQKFETIKKEVHIEGKKIQQINNRGHYTHMWLRFRPIARGQGIQFRHSVSVEKFPRNLVAAIENGVRRALGRKGQEGYPVTDVHCSIDGSFHPIDSDAADYDAVAFRATIDAIQKAGTESIDGLAS